MGTLLIYQTDRFAIAVSRVQIAVKGTDSIKVFHFRINNSI